MFEPKYKRVLLKLSGEAISGKDGIIDFDFLDRIAATLVEISAAGVETAVVFGAGNIWRGRQGVNACYGHKCAGGFRCR